MTTRGMCLKGIALIQLVVMLMLAGPGHCLELLQAHGQEDTCVSVPAAQQHQDHSEDGCPCCPADESEGDACAACFSCAFYAPLAHSPAVSYRPSVTPLRVFDSFTKLADVEIPIFVPPQNHA